MDSAIKVAVVRSDRRRGAVAEALALLADDLGRRVAADPNPVIVPNLDTPSKPWACTHRDTVSAAADAVLSAGATSITVTGAAQPMPPRTADPRATLGYRTELWGREATFPDVAETPDFWSTIRWISGRGEPVAIRVPSHVAASRCLISLGVARTHEFFRVGLGLTNLTGLVHREDRGPVGWRPDSSIAFLPAVATILGMVQPWRGWLVRAWLSVRAVAGGMRPTRRERLMLDVVERATDRLVELAGLLLPRFSLIDGFSGMQGDGPWYGGRVPLGTVIAGNDAVAVDAVAASLMGFEPMEIGYLRQAQAMGLGTADLSAITVVGDPMSQLRRRFRRHARDRLLRLARSPGSAVRPAGSPRPHFGAVPAQGQLVARRSDFES
jgi:uncharacterized protein (DUF362 family)